MERKGRSIDKRTRYEERKRSNVKKRKRELGVKMEGWTR